MVQIFFVVFCLKKLKRVKNNDSPIFLGSFDILSNAEEEITFYKRFWLTNVFDFFYTGDLDANRPVPFRLTPNIAEFLTTTGVTGPLTASMIATARCFVQPQYKLPSFLRAILRDEYITWHKKVSCTWSWKWNGFYVLLNKEVMRNLYNIHPRHEHWWEYSSL